MDITIALGVCEQCVAEGRKSGEIYRLELCKKHYDLVVPAGVAEYAQRPVSPLQLRPVGKVRPGQSIEPDYRLEIALVVNRPPQFTKSLSPVSRPEDRDDDGDDGDGPPQQTHVQTSTSASNSATDATPDDNATESEMTLESACSFIAVYLATPKNVKPSLWLLFQAGEVLYRATVGKPKTAVRLIASTSPSKYVTIQRAWNLRAMAEETRTLLIRAHEQGIRLSFGWVHDNVHGINPSIQAGIMQGKARKLGIKLD